MQRSISILALMLGCLVVSLPASGQDPVIPVNMEGEWEFTSMISICGSSTVDTTEVDTLVFCSGEIFNPGEGFYDCTGTISSSTIDVDCSWEFDLRPEADCVITYSLVIDGTISGDTITGMATDSVTNSGTQCFDEDSCETASFTATRISPASGQCFAPVEPRSWGRIKAMYD